MEPRDRSVPKPRCRYGWWWKRRSKGTRQTSTNRFASWLWICGGHSEEVPQKLNWLPVSLRRGRQKTWLGLGNRDGSRGGPGGLPCPRRIDPASARANGERATTHRSGRLGGIAGVFPGWQDRGIRRGFRRTATIWVRLLAGGLPLAITEDDLDHYGPRWSPDSASLIYYTPPAQPGEPGTLWEVPALGGSARRLLETLGPGDISHDGMIIAFFRFRRRSRVDGRHATCPPRAASRGCRLPMTRICAGHRTIGLSRFSQNA